MFDENMFNNIDFGPLKDYLDNDDITDISYSNNGQLWLKSLSQGVYRAENQNVNNAMIEKIAFQCSNIMGKTFNMAHPFLDAESAELRLNFVHDSIAKNGIAVVMRKTPAKIRLKKEKIIEEKYITEELHDFLLKCVDGYCNIIVSGETGSGKTEFVKYLASHTKENDKLITIEDTLELHLDRIYPFRDIVAMKTNNIASYSDVLVTCMRQNPKWILLSEVRSAEAVTAVRNSISSGHKILSTIHAERAQSIPHRMYSLLETNLDLEQFLKSIYRYIQLGVHVRGYMDLKAGKFRREVVEVCEFYVDNNNNAQFNIIYRKTSEGQVTRNNPSQNLLDYLAASGVIVKPDVFIKSGEAMVEATEPVQQATEQANATAPSRFIEPTVDQVAPIASTQVNVQPVEQTIQVAPAQSTIIPQVQNEPVETLI
jgi:pilus assembly protein CpaF